jgi:hypothetical protein
MVPVLDAEKGWGGLGTQKFLEVPTVNEPKTY